jgi:hypothetical protein
MPRTGGWKRGRQACLLGLALGLGACTAPSVAPKPPTQQASGTHMADWGRVATRIADGLQQTGYIPAPGAGSAAPNAAPARPFYIHVAADGSTFLHSVREALAGEILRRGGSVRRSAAEAVVVNLDVEVVGWGPRPQATNGLGTLAGAAVGVGLLVGQSAPITILEAAGLSLAAGVATDVVSAMAAQNFTAEAAWRASIYEGDRLTFQQREPMYIHAGDIPLYRGTARLAAVSTGPTTTSLPIVPVRYVR